MIKWIIAPLVGGVIGYITNDLAIRMLFRPRKALYIGRLHVPFTPGLIPSQQPRIASSIGRVVSEQLLNEETLRRTLLSEETLHALQEKVRQAVMGLALDQRTVKEVLAAHYDPVRFNAGARDMEKKLTELICARINEAKLGYTIVDSLTGSLAEAIAQNRLLALLLDGGAQKALRQKLAEKLDEIIAEKAPDAVYGIIDKYRRDLMKLRVCDIYEKYRDKQDWLIEKGTDLYVSLLGNNLGRLLNAINIEKIVVDKINAFDAAQLEDMIFGIMKRELRAIVYLGALLGFFMGFVNLLF